MFDYDDRVPADLLVRWTSLDPDRVVLVDLAGFLATAGALLVAGIGLVGVATAGPTAGVGVVMCLVGLLVAAVTTTMRRRWQRRNHLRGRDIDLVLAHRREIRFEPWNQLIDREQPLDSWPEEARLAHRAERAVRAIQATTVWPDPDLLDHRLRIDLPENARRIQVAAWHLHVLRLGLGPRPCDSESGRLTLHWQDAVAHHAHSLQVLGHHVTALEDYRAAVHDLDRTVEIAHRAARLQDLTDRAVPWLTTQDAHHELATEHLNGLRGELESFGRQPATG